MTRRAVLATCLLALAAATAAACAGCYTVPLRRPAPETEQLEDPYCRGFQESAESLATDWLIGVHPKAPLYRYARFGYLAEGVFKDEHDQEWVACEFIAHVHWTDDTMAVYRFVFLDGEIVEVKDETPHSRPN